MSEEAPTVIAAVEFDPTGSLQGQGHYMGIPTGAAVTIEHNTADQTDANSVSVITTCCGTNMGKVDPTSGATLAKWMAKGVFFTCAVKEPASVVNGYVGPIISQPVVIRCVPIKGKSVSTEIKKVKEVEDA